MKVKFGVLKQTDRLHLQAEFHLNVFIVSPSGGQKPQFWANFDFGGSCTDPLLPMRAKSGVLQLTHSTRFSVEICLDRFILSLSVLRVLYIVASMGVKFGKKEGTFGSLLRAKFHPIGATCRPCGAKILKIGLRVN